MSKPKEDVDLLVLVLYAGTSSGEKQHEALCALFDWTPDRTTAAIAEAHRRGFITRGNGDS